MKILRLTLKKKWFDMISSGIKKEEYRTPGKWIYSRLVRKDYDAIEFVNGYGADKPRFLIEYRGFHHGVGKPEWGAAEGQTYVVIAMGRLLSKP